MPAWDGARGWWCQHETELERGRRGGVEGGRRGRAGGREEGRGGGREKGRGGGREKGRGWRQGEGEGLEAGRRSHSLMMNAPVPHGRVHFAGQCPRCPQWSRSASVLRPAAPDSGRSGSSQGFSWACPPLRPSPRSSPPEGLALNHPAPTCFAGFWNMHEWVRRWASKCSL